MRLLSVAALVAVLLCSLVDASYFLMGKRAMNPFLDSMGKRAMNPFLDSMGKRSVRTFEDLPMSMEYFDSLAGQSLGKRSAVALVPVE
ncbi:hypothetical protein PMAYCL1PPCAC_32639, partial [Pristionchus mayeri]